ncbi:hypothetical protein BSL78_12152 [Apostichopus japonicus]|uniref:Uncharacterized protein n=1 Tax=Stichopus japonicus TaxID=307972 RepID=A0A2G8KSK0_STIJA|nr:hypothetical protein BSL78_12152 [Apostichopus japonicus]
MNENSLRGQQERFEMNISQATRTFEVCSGNDTNNVSMGRDYGAIIQADDDVIVLEDTSDSDSETDEDVPLIWGDLNSTGHVQQQDHASHNPSGFQQNMQRGGGSAVSQTLVGQRNGEAGESLVVCQTPWSNQTLMVFQEEEDTECALSAVEIMAQRSLAERRRFGRGHLWHSANSTPWNEVNNQS